MSRRALCTVVLLGGLASCVAPVEPVPDGISMADLGDERVRPRPEILSEEEWMYSGRPGRVIRTAHYRLYTTERDDVLRRRLVMMLEYALAHYRTALAPLPPAPQRLDTYLMDNRAQWVDVTKRLMGERAAQLSMIERGGYASRGIGVYYDLGLYDTLAIAAHEGWHQYTQRTFKDSLPVWFEEGAATYMEGHRWAESRPTFLSWANVERYEQLLKAHGEGTLMPLDALLRERPQSMMNGGNDGLLTYYAQLWALLHFLDEGEGGRYATRLRTLLLDAAEGRLTGVISTHIGGRASNAMLRERLGEAVFRVYIDDDMPRLSAEYSAFIDAVVRPGSRSAIAAGISPVGPGRGAQP